MCDGSTCRDHLDGDRNQLFQLGKGWKCDEEETKSVTNNKMFREGILLSCVVLLTHIWMPLVAQTEPVATATLPEKVEPAEATQDGGGVDLNKAM